MPDQAVWMIRLSFVSLFIAVLLGGLLLIHKAVPIHPAFWGLLPVHFELAIWGWLVQFVMGTAYWIFPRFMKGEARGSSNIAWIMIILLNTGLIILVAAQLPLFDWLNYTGLIGRGFILGSIILFGFLIWFRVISYRGKHQH